MRSDEDVREDVESELRWDPGLDATDIVVAVREGAVTLTGFVRSFNEKWEAEDVAKRVSGVLGVANDLDVRLPSISQRPDPDIARDAVTALLYELPDLGNIKVVVKEGLVRLEGDVESQQQRRNVARAVRRVRGIKGIVNTITVRSPRRAGRYPSENCRGVETQRPARSRQYHGGSKRRRSGAERNGPFMGRAQGSR